MPGMGMPEERSDHVHAEIDVGELLGAESESLAEPLMAERGRERGMSIRVQSLEVVWKICGTNHLRR